MKLNNRLAQVASFIEDDSSVIDVGCDHAFLDIYLAQNKKMKKIIASDNKEGPLEKAKENVRKAHLEKEITLLLSSGIEKLDPTIDTLVISGMGGLNMVGICKYESQKMKQFSTLVLSPNNEVEFVRREFVKMGFHIDQEALVLDKDIIYPVLRFKRGRKFYRKKEYLLGPLLMKEESPLFKKWNAKELKQKELLLNILPKSYMKRRREIKKEIKIRKEIGE